MDSAPRPSPTGRSLGLWEPVAVLGVAFGTATALGLLFAVQSYVTVSSSPGYEGGFPVTRAFVTQALQWWVWAALVLPVFLVLDRWAPIGASWGRLFAVHAGLAVVICALHAVATGWLSSKLGLIWPGRSFAEVARRALVLRFFSNVLTFGLIAALFHVQRHIAALRASRERIRSIEHRRSEGVFQLAGAVAHDLSNRLTVVTGLWELMQAGYGHAADSPALSAREIEELNEALSEMGKTVKHIAAIGMSGYPLRLRRLHVEALAAEIRERVAAHHTRWAVDSGPVVSDGEHVVEVDLEHMQGVVDAMVQALAPLDGRCRDDEENRKLRMEVTVVSRPLEGAFGPGRFEETLMEVILRSPSSAALDEDAFEPRFVQSDRTIRSTLDLTAARATVMRMGGELSTHPGGFRLVIPVVHKSDRRRTGQE